MTKILLIQHISRLSSNLTVKLGREKTDTEPESSEILYDKSTTWRNGWNRLSGFDLENGMPVVKIAVPRADAQCRREERSLNLRITEMKMTSWTSDNLSFHLQNEVFKACWCDVDESNLRGTWVSTLNN